MWSDAHDRQRLEQLCRYITRPTLPDERVQLNAAGQVVLNVKSPWRDGTTHLVLSVDVGPELCQARPARLCPPEFMQRLAAQIARPRLHLIRLVSA